VWVGAGAAVVEDCDVVTSVEVVLEDGEDDIFMLVGWLVGLLVGWFSGLLGYDTSASDYFC